MIWHLSGWLLAATLLLGGLVLLYYLAPLFVWAGAGCSWARLKLNTWRSNRRIKHLEQKENLRTKLQQTYEARLRGKMEAQNKS